MEVAKSTPSNSESSSMEACFGWMGARACVRSARKAGLVSRSSWPPPLTVGMHAPPQTARTCVVQAALLRMLDHAYILFVWSSIRNRAAWTTHVRAVCGSSVRLLDHTCIFSRLAEYLLMESGLNEKIFVWSSIRNRAALTTHVRAVCGSSVRLLDHTCIFSRSAEYLLMESGLNEQVLC